MRIEVTAAEIDRLADRIVDGDTPVDYFDANGHEVDATRFTRAVVVAMLIYGDVYVRETYCADGTIERRIIRPDRVAVVP